METLEVGKTYQHKTIGTVVEVRGIRPTKYVDGIKQHYRVIVLYCDANATKDVKIYEQLLLPEDKANEWEEVIVDCDGLVYKLTRNGKED